MSSRLRLVLGVHVGEGSSARSGCSCARRDPRLKEGCAVPGGRLLRRSVCLVEFTDLDGDAAFQSSTEASSGLLESGRRNARARSTPVERSPARPMASQTLESDSWLTSAKAGRTSSLIESDCSSTVRPCRDRHVRTQLAPGCGRRRPSRDPRPIRLTRHRSALDPARGSASVRSPWTTHDPGESAGRCRPAAGCAASGSRVCSQISRAHRRGRRATAA